MADKHPCHRSTCQHYGLVILRRSLCLLAANVIDPTGSMNKAQDLSWLRDDPSCEGGKIAGFAFAAILIFMQMFNNLQTHWHSWGNMVASCCMLMLSMKTVGCFEFFCILSNPKISSWSRFSKRSWKCQVWSFDILDFFTSHGHNWILNDITLFRT